MKRVFILLLALMLFLASFITSYAEESDMATNYLNIRYVDLTRLSASLNISGTTASCSGTAKTLISTDTIKMSMYLQKQTSTGWSNVSSWYKQGVRLVTLKKDKSGLTAGTYRVRLYVLVYDSNGSFIESANVYSQLKIVS